MRHFTPYHEEYGHPEIPLSDTAFLMTMTLHFKMAWPLLHILALITPLQKVTSAVTIGEETRLSSQLSFLKVVRGGMVLWSLSLVMRQETNFDL